MLSFQALASLSYSEAIQAAKKLLIKSLRVCEITSSFFNRSEPKSHWARCPKRPTSLKGYLGTERVSQGQSMYLCLTTSIATAVAPSNSLLVLLSPSHFRHPSLHLLQPLQDRHSELVICIKTWKSCVYERSIPRTATQLKSIPVERSLHYQMFVPFSTSHSWSSAFAWT